MIARRVVVVVIVLSCSRRRRREGSSSSSLLGLGLVSLSRFGGKRMRSGVAKRSWRGAGESLSSF